MLNAIKYIQFNYSHDISIDDVAKSVGVSRSHLYRVFMLNVGKSPIDYLTDYRINEACKLLRAGNLSIAEVAVSVGYFALAGLQARQGRAAQQVPRVPDRRRRDAGRRIIQKEITHALTEKSGADADHRAAFQ